MANSVSNVSFANNPNDYSIDLANIERRRQLAQALQSQGMQPLGNTEMVGGWAVKRSPFEGLNKVAQSALGAYQQEELSNKEKEVGRKYQQDLADTLMKANQAGMGTPARPGVDVPPDETGGGPGYAATPAVAPDRNRMAQILMQHPATQQMGMQQSMSDMQMQRIIEFLKGAQSSQGTQPANVDPNAAPGTAPAPQNGGGGNGLNFPGVSQPALGLAAMNGNPDDIGKLLQSGFAATQKPTRVNAGGAVVDASGKVLFSAPQNNGVLTNYGPNGPTQTNVPGSLNANTAATGAAEAGKAPYSMQQMDVPVYLPGGDQINVKMNATQAHQYQTTGQLPPEIAASIPGMQRPAPGIQPPGSPVQPAPPQAAPMGAQPIPNASPIPVRSGATPISSSVAPSVSMQEIERIQDPAERAAAMAAFRSKNGNGPIPVSSLTGTPVVGRSNSQNEQITQQRQAAGGKAVDENFAKDYLQFTQGGAADATKQLSQLQDVVTALGKPNANLSGPIMGSMPDMIKKFTPAGQRSIAMRERVEEVAQRSLRAVLGAQFTEKEGERLISRAYNPNQPEPENAIRVGRLFSQLEQALKAKQDASNYYQKNGTLQGWQGKMPSMSDFDIDSGPAAAPTSGGGKIVKWSDL